MEMEASFGEWQRSTSHVLSFSTSVLLFRGIAMQISLPFGYRCFVVKEKCCFVDWFSVVPYPPLPLYSHSHPYIHPTPFFLLNWFFLNIYFTLNWAAKKKRKKGVKNQQRGSIRPSSVCEVSFSSIWRKASEWRKNETKLFPVTFDPASSKSMWSGGRGTGVPWLGYRHLALTSRLHLCPLKLGLFSLNCSEAWRRATVWLTTNPRGIFIWHSLHCRTTNGFYAPN